MQKKKSSQKSAVVLQKTDIFNVCFFFFVFYKNFEQWHF